VTPGLVDVGAITVFPEGRATIVQAAKRQLGIVHWNERFYALRNVCPHLGAPLCGGVVKPYIAGRADAAWALDVNGDRPMVVCPWHRWEFDAGTGRALVGSLRVKTYPVTIVDGRVVVDMRPSQ
jgi:nitrite reductase (NADH) small subunit